MLSAMPKIDAQVTFVASRADDTSNGNDTLVRLKRASISVHEAIAILQKVGP